jgi:hypothetical protein
MEAIINSHFPGILLVKTGRYSPGFGGGGGGGGGHKRGSERLEKPISLDYIFYLSGEC